MSNSTPGAPGQIALPASETSLLVEAEQAGLRPAYSCRTGRCSTCRAKVHAGETAVLHEELGLSDDERDQGWILTCVRSAVTEVEIEFDDVLPDVELPVPRTVPCRINTVEHVAPGVVKVELRLPPTQPLSFLSGQHIEVIGPGGARRAYSLAHALRSDGQLELHIRHFDGGVMSSYWFEHAAENDLLRLYGPLGTFVLRDVASKHLVFLATGTGIAPVASHLEALDQLAPEQRPHRVSVFWGNRSEQDVYWRPDTELEVEFVPVLSRAGTDWSGSRGHVQDLFLAEDPDLSEVVVYACGSDAMIHEAHAALIEHGLDPHRFYSDAFVSSAGFGSSTQG
jgi:CDP-4-dehydro-6-deoxyglucose reductase, E3